MGSVKTLEVIKQPTAYRMGIGRFHFSDDYSVFDWGTMPDAIAGKGKALCMTGAYMFERAEDSDIPNHYRGLVDHNDRIMTTDETDVPLDVMEVDLVRVIKPKFVKTKKAYDYSAYKPGMTNYLVPLEIIYRNELPDECSVFKRLMKSETTPEALGLDRYPFPGEKLAKPILDVSTKLEKGDRYISWGEAARISGSTPAQILEMQDILSRTNNLITREDARAGMENADGKIELGRMPNGKYMLVDVIGTADECRILWNGMHFNKELARKYYADTEWKKAWDIARERAKELGIENPKELCQLKPQPWDAEFGQIMSWVYQSPVNKILGRKLFDSPSLDQVAQKYKAYARKVA